MPTSEVIHEYKMPSMIRAKLKKSGYRPKPSDVQRALTRVYNNDPSRFGNEESRKVVIQDVVSGFLARYAKAKKGADEMTTVEGEWLPFPTGYQYAILIASRLNQLIKEYRQFFELPNGQPFESFLDAVTWMDKLNTTNAQGHQQTEARWSTVSLDLPAEKVTKLKEWVTSIQNQQESPDVTVEIPIESGFDTIRNILGDFEIHTIRFDEHVRRLTLFSHNDYAEQEGTSWDINEGTEASSLFRVCQSLLVRVPEWDLCKVFSFFLLGRLPLLPIRQGLTGVKKGQAPFKFSLEVLYPLREDTLLRFYKRYRDQYNNPDTRLYNFDPPNMREYDLVLLDLVFRMPLDDYSWSQRLQQYLTEYEKEVKAGFLPDLGLYSDSENRDFNNAARNMGRDYKSAWAKLL